MSVATSSSSHSASSSAPTVAPPAPLPGSVATAAVSAPKPRSLLVEFLLGGCATMTAALFTNPIEVVKTRMQVQGELVRIGRAQQLYTNPFQAFYLIGREEGLKGLQGGLGPAVLYQLMMNGTRLGAYEPLKRLYTSNGERKEMWRSVAAGSTSGVLSAVMGSPFFLIKVRLQVQSDLTQKLQQQVSRIRTLRTVRRACSSRRPVVCLPRRPPCPSPRCCPSATSTRTRARGRECTRYSARRAC